MTSDRISGVVTGLIGVALIVGASGLPAMPGQQIGPSVFPTVIGAGLVLCGFLIAMGVGRSLEDEEVIVTEGDGPAPPPPPALPVQVLRAALPIALLLFYVFTIKTLGFLIVAAVIVLVMALALGARPGRAALLALVASPLIHFIFASLLRVPLAPGLLPAPW